MSGVRRQGRTWRTDMQFLRRAAAGQRRRGAHGRAWTRARRGAWRCCRGSTAPAPRDLCSRPGPNCTATEFTPPIPPDDESGDEPRRPLISVIGYSVAAIVALGRRCLARNPSERGSCDLAAEDGRGVPGRDREPGRRCKRPDRSTWRIACRCRRSASRRRRPSAASTRRARFSTLGKSGLLDTYRGVLAGGSRD